MVVVSVTLQVPLEKRDAFWPSMEELVLESRKEPGVLAYTFSVDILDARLVRIFEVYADQAALDAHMASSHFQAWRPLSELFARQERWLMDATRRS